MSLHVVSLLCMYCKYIVLLTKVGLYIRTYIDAVKAHCVLKLMSRSRSGWTRAGKSLNTRHFDPKIFISCTKRKDVTYKATIGGKMETYGRGGGSILGLLRPKNFFAHSTCEFTCSAIH